MSHQPWEGSWWQDLWQPEVRHPKKTSWVTHDDIWKVDRSQAGEGGEGNILEASWSSANPASGTKEGWEQIWTLTCWGPSSNYQRILQGALFVSNPNLKVLPQTQPAPPSSITASQRLQQLWEEPVEMPAGQWEIGGLLHPTLLVEPQKRDQKGSATLCPLELRLPTQIPYWTMTVERAGKLKMFGIDSKNTFALGKIHL